MKRFLVVVGVGGLLLLSGFALGAFVQRAQAGYHYKLLGERDYASPLGPVKWTCFIESVGFPFLDPEKTMITVGDRTIYKAQRGFQEDDPHARNIEISENSITWEDGDFRYHLTMEAIGDPEVAPSVATPDTPADQPQDSLTAPGSSGGR